MEDQRRRLDAIWRIEAARLTARLGHLVRDFGLAEDLAQDALVAALETWPVSGIPAKPGAWLMTVARNKAYDHLRRDRLLKRKLEEYGRERGEGIEMDLVDFDADRDLDDDVLSLMFTACHPLLASEARIALTLRVIGGLSTAEIARAYLAQESTIAQRIVRAKRSLAEARVPFALPRGDELVVRLDSVLEVIYLIFNEGYAASSGADWMRPALCEEAMRLGRILANLMPGASEVQGLVALMEIQASRLPARLGPKGEPVLLADQNRGRWDWLLARSGLSSLEKAFAAAGRAPKPLGPYALQASIAACHARAPSAAETDWAGIAALYDALGEIAPSPIIELNRAVALSMAYGPALGLEIVDRLQGESALDGYHLLPSVRGDLLFKLGRLQEATAEFKRAASLAHNGKERELLLDRAERSLPATSS